MTASWLEPFRDLIVNPISLQNANTLDLEGLINVFFPYVRKLILGRPNSRATKGHLAAHGGPSFCQQKGPPRRPPQRSQMAQTQGRHRYEIGHDVLLWAHHARLALKRIVTHVLVGAGNPVDLEVHLQKQ